MAVAAAAVALTIAGCSDSGAAKVAGGPEREAARQRAEELARQLEREQRTPPESQVPGVPGVPVPPTASAPPVDMLHGDGALVAVRAFRARLGEALRVTEVFLYADGRMIVETQDPARPENVDRYVFRDGQIEDPEPVRVSAADLEELPRALFSLGDVRWDAIPTLSTTTLEQLAIDDAQVSHMGVYRPLPFSTDVRIRVFANGIRRSGYLDARADGSVIEAHVS